MAALPISIRVALSLAFIAAGGYCLRYCFLTDAGDGADPRVSNGMHVLMSATMLTMIWNPLAAVGGYLAAAFVICATWFAVGVTGIPLRMASFVPNWPEARPAPAAPAWCGANRWGHRWRCGHHALAMATMGWMFLLPGMSGRHGMSGMSMGSMAMNGTIVSTMRIGTGYFCVAALALGYAWLRGRDHRTTGGRHHDGVHALMTAGMATMIFTMS